MKKNLLILFISIAMILAMLPMTAMALPAENVSIERAGAVVSTHASLADAIAAAQSGDTIKLLGAVAETEGMSIEEGVSITLDLAGNTLTMSDAGKFTLNGGALTVIDSVGDGAIEASVDGFFRVIKGTLDLQKGTFTQTGTVWNEVIYISGSDNSEAENYSVVNIGENATLNFADEIYGYGVRIAPPKSTTNYYGIVLDIDGVIDTTSLGASVYVNGVIKGEGSVAKINVNAGAELTGMAYGAGNADWVISGKLSGQTGIEMKNGTLTVNEGASITATSPFTETQNGNGSDVIGAAISMITSEGYASGKPSITINGGTLAAADEGKAFYQNMWSGDLGQAEINNGSFLGEIEANELTSFINGGTFAEDPSAYIAEDGALAGFTPAEGAASYVVGAEIIAQKAAEAAEGDAINIIAGDVELINMPEGVTVKNDGNGQVTVNGSELAAGSEVVTKHTHNAVKTEAKAPTATAEGNIEYWYCAGCDKYFSDEALTEEITLEDTVIPATGSQPGPNEPAGDASGMWIVLMMLAAATLVFTAFVCKPKSVR